MTENNNSMTPADIAAVIGNHGCNNGYGGFGGFGGFGGNDLYSLIILFVFASMFGYGGFGGFGGMNGMWPWLFMGNGFGFGGNNCGCNNNCATQADIASGFNNSTVLRTLGDLQLSQAGVQQTLCQGFGGVNTAIGNLGYDISRQLSECCCGTQRAIDGMKYQMATDTCAVQNTINGSTRDIVENQNNNARAILDALTAQRLADKDERIAEQNQKIFALELAASQANQNGVIRAAIDASTAEILRRTGHDCPTAAYLVNAPTPVNFPVNQCGTVQFANSGSCCNPCGGF